MRSRTATADESQERNARDRAIADFAAQYLSGENQDIYEDMLVTVCRLARDRADRGSVKLLHKALAELRYAFKVFEPYHDRRKISIFGSSRTGEDHPDYQAAVDFGRQMSQAGWMVITGAGDGIMKAGHDGAGVAASFGVAIRLPFEQKTNEVIAEDDKLVNFRYFFTRKLMFMKEASAVALFPGGFGTQDEGFEALTLIQTGKAPIIPLVLCEQPGGTYWLQWRAYVKSELLNAGMISPEDMNLFFLTDDVEAAAREVTMFYRVYHSMRYVGDELVLRLLRPLSAETLVRLNDEFSHILTSGHIAQSGPLAAEGNELPQMTRLRLHFDRKSHGHLRLLLNVVNAEPGEVEDSV